MRPANLSEVERVVSLWKEFMNDPSAIDEPIPAHEENAKKQVQLVEELIREDPRQVLVAEEGGELVGYMLYRRDQKTALEMKHKMSYIYDLYVRPGSRRQGVGGSLLQACLDDLRAAGPHQIRLNVWTRNENAIRLYRKMGFRDHLMVMRADTGPPGT
ncbi:MAG TPA: GNAT family N-acetyltransferase [Nitrososphaerales archaeon]|nr:GNAT family N-acetyltransferase [Nitrososphaerales archaeon]